MLPQARATALSVRGVTRMAVPSTGANAPRPREGGIEAVWLWLDADARPVLKQFWSLPGDAGGGTSETWWLCDIDDAPAAPPLPVFAVQTHSACQGAGCVLPPLPLPDLAWALDLINEAPCVGLSVSPVPAELGRLHGLSETLQIANERMPQLLRSSVIIDELSRGDLQKYLQRWRSSRAGPESGPSARWPAH